MPASNRIIYSRGFPYGAPLAMLRGGGTKNEAVKQYLKEKKFVWNSRSYAWESYYYKAELREILCNLRDAFQCEVVPKDGIDPSYIIDL
jgi:hypothetical protein